MITWRSLQAQLPTMALCTAMAALMLMFAVMFAPHTRAQDATFLANWAYVETREAQSINPPLTILQLKHAPAVDATGALLYPVLVYLGNGAAGDGLVSPMSYTVTGSLITFGYPFIPWLNMRMPLPSYITNAAEVQVLYVYAPTDAALAAAAAAQAAAAAAILAKQPAGPSGATGAT